MGVSRDQNSSRGRILKQTSNMRLSRQTGRAKGRSFRQAAEARWRAAGCLGACVFTPTPKVAATKVKDGQVRRDQGEVGDFGLSGFLEVAGLVRQAVRMWERAASAGPPREDTAADRASPYARSALSAM